MIERSIECVDPYQSNGIINEVGHITRVCYYISRRRPATIEWEWFQRLIRRLALKAKRDLLIRLK